jgi:hypothetical protein
MVEQGEHFDPKLELKALSDREILEHRKIDGFEARGVEQVAAGVSVGVGAGCNWIQIIDCEGGGVDTADQTPGAAIVGGGLNQIRPPRAPEEVLAVSVPVAPARCGAFADARGIVVVDEGSQPACRR